MLKIGICDDDPTFVDDIEKNIEQTIKKHHWNGKIVKFTDGRKLVRSNEKNKFDIIFLDIDMPEKDGFSVARDIPEKDSLLVCKLRLNGMPVPLLRNGYSIFNGTKYR